MAPLRVRARQPAAAAAAGAPYVDGQLVPFEKTASGTGAGTFANSSLNFMSRGAASLFGAGSLDEVALYSRALTRRRSPLTTRATTQSPTASFSGTPTRPTSARASPSTAPARPLRTARSPNTSGISTATAATRPTPAPRRPRPAPTPAPASSTVGLRVTDSAGKTATTTARSASTAAGSAPTRAAVLGHRRAAQLLAPGRARGHRPSPTARARPATAHGGPTLGAPGAVAGDTDTAVSFDGTTGAASGPSTSPATNQLTSSSG